MSILFSTLKYRLQTMIGDAKGVYADKYGDTINNASRELYDDIFRRLIDETLITGNALPNAHFEDWSQTTYPDHWNVSNVAAVEEATIIRGGAKSAKVTRDGTDGYMYCSNAEWGGLINLEDSTATFKCWVLASSASQAYIEIYTKQADGTEQTETSGAHSGGGEYELLEIEDFSLNDNLTDIQFRCKVITTNGDVYFDNSRETGKGMHQLLLPLNFHEGTVSQVRIQISGHSDDACDDLNLGDNNYAEEFGWNTYDDGSYKYLRFDYAPASNRKINLVGYAPLEILSSDTDTMTIDDRRVNLLLQYAAHLIYEMQAGIVSGDNKSLYEGQGGYHFAKAEILRRKLKMGKPQGQIGWR